MPGGKSSTPATPAEGVVGEVTPYYGENPEVNRLISEATATGGSVNTAALNALGKLPTAEAPKQLSDFSPEEREHIDEAAEIALAKAFGFRRVVGKDGTEELAYFRLAKNWRNTTIQIQEALGVPPENLAPDPVYPWECRIGGSLFMVPPVSINVSTTFQAGAVTAGALRSTSSPKFNSGYSETVVEMTLYFPNHDSIWGFADPETFEIDFDKQDEGNFRVIDHYLSSLRGLITQFRYAPFLPVRNTYLNMVHNISAVALQSMSVSNVPGYPFCLAVNLSMLKFNHKVFLPMVSNFDEAIHWGKFRQYMGRAAARMTRLASKNFLTQKDVSVNPEDNQPLGDVASTVVNAADILHLDTAEDIMNSYEAEDLSPKRTFNKKEELTGGLDWGDSLAGAASHFELYYPFHDPARIDLPDLSSLAPKADDGTKARNWWQSLLNNFGIKVLTETHVTSEEAARYAEEFGTADHVSADWKLLIAFGAAAGNAVETWNEAKFEAYAAQRIKENPELKNADQAKKDAYKTTLHQMWWGALYHLFLQDPTIARRLAYQDLKRGKIFIQEWEVPMRSVGLHELRDYVKVQGVSVSMGNNLARLQVQMQQEPTYQHIGGLDTQCQIQMLVYGETPIIKMRMAFEVLSGLSRIEHQHAVLGFLGIKNAITALCGMRYCMMSGFEVNTIPNMPHVYDVRLTLTDFDIFQQKREVLSAEQQAELVLAFKTKKNPFLRIKQLWGAFNAYPDFPLAVKDDKGNVIGNLDPDFYFKAYHSLDDDIHDFNKPDDPAKTPEQRAVRAQNNMEHLREEGTHWSFGKYNDPMGDWLSVTDTGITLRAGGEVQIQDGQWNEQHASNTLLTPTVPGLTPGADVWRPYQAGGKDQEGKDSHTGQYQAMMLDTQYRNKSGRMVRAFPTYMLWLINEQGMYAGVKLFDNFYGLQSVVDLSVHQSEDVMGDTLVLRVSNLYSRLSTPFGDTIDERYSNIAAMFNSFSDQQRRLLTGFNDYMVRLDTVEIAPGARIHLRVGYSSNPNAMDTVFNGVVTEVETGEILTITAQSDAIELGAVVNSTNTEGHSGKVDGNMVGFYLSEPRDLMVRLLTMGSSVFKEMFAHATQGKVFSESKFGIRHFGSVLYQEMTDAERDGTRARKARMNQYMGALSGTGVGAVGTIANQAGNLIGYLNPQIADLTNDLWINLSLKGDYELHKRNIYPGNGTGIAQYMGGDLGEGALNLAMMPTGVDGSGKLHDPTTGREMVINTDPRQIIQDSLKIQLEQGDETDTAWEVYNSQAGWTQLHEFTRAMGITSRGDDDLRGFDEVSFRASTYMKTVWDMFQLCAALLPNYIVAVRPFEDRSTVFYGKPHWTYTSGVVPLTTGPGLVQDGEGNPIETGPDYSVPDEEWRALYDKLTEELGQDRQKEDFFTQVSGVISVDPSSSIRGLPWDGDDPSSLPSEEHREGIANSAKLIYTRSLVGMGMHLPTADTLEKDKEKHYQISGLPPAVSHPFYMDRAGYKEYAGTSSGMDGYGDTTGSEEWSEGGKLGEADVNEWRENTAALSGDQAEWAGVASKLRQYDFEDPKEETFYIAQPWEVSDIANLKGSRLLIWSPRTMRGCIVTPGDIAPPNTTIVSPDVIYSMGIQPNIDVCFVGFLDREKYKDRLGPIDLADFSLHTTPDSKPGFTGPPSPVPDWMIDSTTGKKEIRIQEAEDQTARILARSASSLPWFDTGKGITDPLKFAIEWGWQAGKNEVPVRIDPSSGLIDEAGQKAASLFGAEADKAKWADDIWHEFRNNFPQEKLVKDILKDVFPQLKGIGSQIDTVELARVQDNKENEANKFIVDYSGSAKSDPTQLVSKAFDPANQQKFIDFYRNEMGITSLNDKYMLMMLQDQINHWKNSANWNYNKTEFRDYGNWDPQSVAFKLQKQSAAEDKKDVAAAAKLKAGITSEDDKAFALVYDPIMAEFLKFMWQNPYMRGWVVRTADRQVHAGAATVSLVGDIAAGAGAGAIIGGIVGGGVFSWATAGVGAAIGGTLGMATNVLEKIGISKLWGDSPDDHSGIDWNFHAAHQVWTVFLREGEEAAAIWAQQNKGVGKDRSDLFGRLVEETYEKGVKPALSLVQQIGHVVGGVLSSVSAFIRLAMMQLTQGTSMKSDMQLRTNMLNRIFNDSVYYKAGSPGSLIQLADNPFTREYGEPVVEIREPFQRVHYLSSFQHILKNQIIENLEGVSTVITAVSNGQHPITVHYDKGAAPEFQREKVVDTGLLWDKIEGLPLIKHLPIVGDLSKIVTGIFNPVTSVRGIMKDTMGAGDEISSKRVALYHLKESMKNIYGGELFIIGDASIRPHDLVYMADVYERMYGLFEVEAVTHHFTPETGFITSVTPNALVTINDPARWSFNSWLHWKFFSSGQLREHYRHALQVAEKQRFSATNTEPAYKEEDLVNLAQSHIEDSTQFSGGIGAIVKDVGAAVAGGFLIPAIAAKVLFKGFKLSFGAGLIGTQLVWGAWEWIRDNMLDQHGCYIQYLTHNGQPMDSGLSPNASMAVGRVHALTLTYRGLNLGKLSTETVGGNPRITTSELLGQLGWTARELGPLNIDGKPTADGSASAQGNTPEGFLGQTSYFVNQTYIAVQQAMQRGDPIPGNFDTLPVRVTTVKDGDTIFVEALDGDMKGYSKEIRMAIVDCPEDHLSDKDSTGQKPDMGENWRTQNEPRGTEDYRGLDATRYTRARLLGKGPSSYTNVIPHIGYDNEVVLRIHKDSAKDKFGRTLAYIFHQGLPGQSKTDRMNYIKQVVQSGTDWQDSTGFGAPISYNQELLEHGKANVEITHLKYSVPGEGVLRAGR